MYTIIRYLSLLVVILLVASNAAAVTVTPSHGDRFANIINQANSSFRFLGAFPESGAISGENDLSKSAGEAAVFKVSLNGTGGDIDYIDSQYHLDIHIQCDYNDDSNGRICIVGVKHLYDFEIIKTGAGFVVMVSPEIRRGDPSLRSG